MITKITFKSGASPQSAPIELEPVPITVFVGPNNSGKSQVLVELEAWSRNGFYTDSVIISNTLFAALTEEQVLQEVEKLRKLSDAHPDPSVVTLRRSIDSEELQLRLSDIINAAANPVTYTGSNPFAGLRRFLTLRLDGATRLSLLNNVKAGDLQDSITSSSIDKLFRNNNLRFDLRQIIYDAIGRYFVIDPTSLGTLRVRFSDRAPKTEGEERGITDEAIAFHKAAIAISQTASPYS